MMQDLGQRLTQAVLRRPPEAYHLAGSFLADPHTYVGKLDNLFLPAARVAERDAISYRGFKVGVAGIVSAHGEKVCIWHAGHNVKLKKDASAPNLHGEDFVLKMARDTKGIILAMIVVGPKQPDNGSSLKTPTLHCCDKCRAKFVQGPELFHEKAFIASIAPDFRTIELMTIPGLVQFHSSGGHDKRGIRTYRDLPEISKEMIWDNSHRDWPEFDRRWETRKFELICGYADLVKNWPDYMRR